METANLDDKFKEFEKLLSENEFTQTRHCLKWLQSATVKIYPQINYNATSYHWKHRVENFVGCYIPNDVFNNACRIAGLTGAMVSNENVCWNIYPKGEKPKTYPRGLFYYDSQNYKNEKLNKINL